MVICLKEICLYESIKRWEEKKLVNLVSLSLPEAVPWAAMAAGSPQGLRARWVVAAVEAALEAVPRVGDGGSGGSCVLPGVVAVVEASSEAAATTAGPAYSLERGIFINVKIIN